jgi:hypothetical protein
MEEEADWYCKTQLLDFLELSEADEIGCADEWFAPCLVEKHHHVTGRRNVFVLDCRDPPVEFLRM